MADAPPPAPPPSPPSGTTKSSPQVEHTDAAQADAAQEPKRRKVQWVGLGQKPQDPDPPVVQPGVGKGGVPHVSISMPDEKEAPQLSAEGMPINQVSFPPIDQIPHRPGYEADIHLPTSGSQGDITPDSSRPPTPGSDIDIDRGERDGLPTRSNRRPRTFAKEAAALVAAHKFKQRSHASRPPPQPSEAPSARRIGTAASHNRTLREARDQHSTGGGGASGGVLSHLLRLYDAPERSASTSTLADGDYSDDESVSGRSTPSHRLFSRLNPSVTSLEESHHHRRGSRDNGRHRHNDSTDSLDRHRHEHHHHHHHHHRRQSDDSEAPDRSSSIDDGRGPRRHRISLTPPFEALAHTATEVATIAPRSVFGSIRFLGREVGEHMDNAERPEAARSNAGVFGALAASTMGLAGVASPAGAKVAPNPSRPGYRIARYSAAEVPTLPHHHSAHPVSRSPAHLASQPASAVASPALLPEKSASADDIGKLKDQPESSSSTTAVSALDPKSNGSGGQPVKHSLSVPDSNDRTSPFGTLHGQHDPQRHNSHDSSGGRSGATTPSGRHKANHLNVKALTDALNPHLYYHESKVLKAAKRGTPSAPGTPSEEVIPEKHHGKASKSAGGLRKRKEKRRQEEIYITMHIAAVLQRQHFVMQLTRALMMFGGPSHRLESQIQSTAKVLDLDVQIVLIYSIVIFSFQDEATHTSETKFIKQNANVELGKLIKISTLHWEVMHDLIGVQEASQEISRLMRSPPRYNAAATIAIGALCSAFIGHSSFRASFIDILVSIPLGALLVAAQVFVASKSDVLSQMFEIIVTAIASFAAAALASTGYFCYTAVISSSIVLILPGWLVCCAALELQSRSIVSGSVRLIWAIIYALFLGLGISIGSQIWTLATNNDTDVDTTGLCNINRGPEPVPWWRQIIPSQYYLLTVPGYAFCLALRNQMPLFCKEMYCTLLLSCGGWAANHYSSFTFVNRSDISSAIGSFVVGLAANVWGKYFQGTAFIVALVPILFQLPSGLANGGLLYFSVTSDNANSFTNGFSVAQQLIQVSLGLVIGLFAATLVVYPLGKKRGGLMAF